MQQVSIYYIQIAWGFKRRHLTSILPHLRAEEREFMEMVQTSKMGPFVDTLKGGDNGNMVFGKVPFES